jgi:hypothetical protein
MAIFALFEKCLYTFKVEEPLYIGEPGVEAVHD